MDAPDGLRAKRAKIRAEQGDDPLFSWVDPNEENKYKRVPSKVRDELVKYMDPDAADLIESYLRKCQCGSTDVLFCDCNAFVECYTCGRGRKSYVQTSPCVMNCGRRVCHECCDVEGWTIKHPSFYPNGIFQGRCLQWRSCQGVVDFDEPIREYTD